jgi:dTDP-4-dehydrorhamnose 3,5-epimerase
MKFTQTPLKGAYLIELEPRGDERGWFARFFCRKELEEHDLEATIVQANNSFSRYRGTFRGLHYQVAPKAEDKLVRCVAGAFRDIIVDLRPDSETFLKHYQIDLTAENRTMLYVPKGFAHGFLTLTDNTEALYMATESYSAQHERGLRYNDSRLAIPLPFEPVVVSEKDLKHSDFDPDTHLR